MMHGEGLETARAEYLLRGEETRAMLERVLPEDWSWEGKAVLDFGCGAGRAIRHLAPLAPETELWGSDIDPRCIQWNDEHLSPPVSFVVNGEAPPLPLPDGKFDLVYSISVFTHITTHWAAWLVELDRVLAPGGRIIASFMGEGMYEAVAGEPLDEATVGMSVYQEGQGWDLGGPMVLHSPWWIEEHWGRLFEIERLLPRGFDHKAPTPGRDDHGVVVLRKSSATATAEELERIDPSNPREAEALDHEVRHLRAEVGHYRRLADRAAGEVAPPAPPRPPTGREGLAAVLAAARRRLR
jgi:SAM-dependent methyltransferase